MKKIVITFGLIAGVIVGSMLMLSMPLYENGTLNFDNGELVGYTTMIVALSLVFFGVKSYRDKIGSLTFGQGMKVGLLITLVAGLLYAISWEISYNTMSYNFTEEYEKYYFEKMKGEDVSETTLKEATEKVESFKALYKNPLIRFGMTLAEILPVGILITLISAIILRKKMNQAAK